MANDLTIVIIAQNEAENLRHLLPQLGFAQQVIVIDNDSTDETKAVAQKFGVKYLATAAQNFSAIRNLALPKLQTEWIFYLDADERVNAPLRAEILRELSHTGFNALTLRRENYCYGQKLNYGGWQQDLVTRIFRRGVLQTWTGEIHESPQYLGSQKVLKSPLIHLTHRNTQRNLAKSSRWTIKEARLLADSGLPPVTKWTILRKMLMEFYRRYFKHRSYKDGMVGFIESLTQACNRAFVYMQVWELQQKPSLPEQYEQIEKTI